jgi:predicted NUDIX family NTP pyrophosphohydrolase
MATLSAGVILYRFVAGALQLLLVHPGGPFWRNKDEGAWSIPKGEYGPDEDPLTVAKREFEEELGIPVPDGTYLDLGEVRQKGRKIVTAFAIEGDLDPSRIASNSFEIEWPPKSGKRASFPEIDRAGWFPLAEARAKILAGQSPLIDRLEKSLLTK